MTKKPPLCLFRNLELDEIEQFEKWARDNYTPGEPINPAWHPVVQRECRLMNTRNLARPYGVVDHWDAEPHPCRMTVGELAELLGRYPKDWDIVVARDREGRYGEVMLLDEESGVDGTPTLTIFAGGQLLFENEIFDYER